MKVTNKHIKSYVAKHQVMEKGKKGRGMGWESMGVLKGVVRKALIAKEPFEQRPEGKK